MSVPAKRYEGAEPYIFISYSHADSGCVLGIVAAMQKRGYRVWWDENITAGEQWTAALANEIADCEIFMPFISQTFADSEYCMQEVRHAKGEKRNIVPVKLDLERTQYPKELKFLLENAQGFSMSSFSTVEAFAARLDAEPLFQRCRAETPQMFAQLAEIVTQSRPTAPLAQVVTRNRPAAPSGAFVGREDKIQAIEDAFRGGQTAVVLYGMGGIGKSEICRKLFWEYAHGAGTRLAGRIGWAMWRGTPKETFYGQFRNIREENAEIHWQQARTYLETLGRDLLMFLDNADTLTETDAAELTQLGCRFLITSRKRPGRLFAVPAGTLTPEQCRILYRRALYEDDACTDAAPDAALDEILRLAAYHTLSVQLLAKTQWAAGLESAEMLSQLRESGFDLRGEDIAYLHNPEQKQNIEEEAAFIDHMSRVFDLSQLRSDADALRALQGMSLLASNTPTPVRDVKKWLDLPNLNGLNRAVKLGWLNDALENGVRKVSIHPVIAAVTRNKVMPDKTFIDAVAGRLNDDMIVGSMGIFTTKLLTLGHAVALERAVPLLCTSNYGRMLTQMGCLLCQQADYDNALVYMKKGAEIDEETLGVEHRSTATAYNNIGSVYWNQGNYAKALEYYQKAFGIRKQTLGTEHPDTAASYGNIGSVYWAQSNYAKALEYYREALRIHEKTLGTEHPDTAASYNNVGSIYDKQGNYAKALKYHRKALRIYEKTLKTEHPDIATSYNNIGNVYWNQGDYDKALEYAQKALRIYETTLGMEHPDTANSYHIVGAAYFKQSNYGEALKWLGKSFAIRLKVLGVEHPLTKSTQEWLDKTKRRLSSEE